MTFRCELINQFPTVSLIFIYNILSRKKIVDNIIFFFTIDNYGNNPILKEFGVFENILNANKETLLNITGIGDKLAEKILEKKSLQKTDD